MNRDWKNRYNFLTQGNKPAEAVECVLNALQDASNDNERFEILLQLATHYRVIGKNRIAIVFLRECMQFSLNFSQKCEFMNEISIVCFYAGDKEAAEYATQFCILQNGVPSFHRQQALSNQYYYLKPLSACKNSRREQLTIPTDFPFISSSACLGYHPDHSNKIVGIVRGVNYSFDDQFRYTVRDVRGHLVTQNYWCELDSETRQLQTCYSLPVIDNNSIPPIIRESTVHGFEDIRMCVIGDKLYALAIDWERCRNGNASILLCHLTQNESRKQYEITRAIPILYEDHLMQKNWTMFSKDNQLFVIYSHHPLVILQIDTESGEYTVVTNRPSVKYNLDQCRGSANPIRTPQDDGWWVLVHEVVQKDTRKYFHRFIHYNDSFEVVRVSKPFYFHHLFVEFSLSVFLNAGKDFITIVYSTKDNTTELLSVPCIEIDWLNPDKL